MTYVHLAVVPLPKKNVTAYRTMARKMGKLWVEHGAAEYRECVGKDLVTRGMPGFPKMAGLKRNETVIVASMSFKTKAQADRAQGKVMSDPRVGKIMAGKPIFDMERMVFGGFDVIVDLPK